MLTCLGGMCPHTRGGISVSPGSSSFNYVRSLALFPTAAVLVSLPQQRCCEVGRGSQKPVGCLLPGGWKPGAVAAGAAMDQGALGSPDLGRLTVAVGACGCWACPERLVHRRPRGAWSDEAAVHCEPVWGHWGGSSAGLGAGRTWGLEVWKPPREPPWGHESWPTWR